MGCETAVYLAQEAGKTVSLVEMTDTLAAASCTIPRTAITKEIETCVDAHTGSRCTGITKDGITYVDAEGEHSIQADTVVLSAGMVPQKAQAEAFRMIAGEFFPIGDCVKANNVRTAVRTGYDSAIQL